MSTSKTTAAILTLVAIALSGCAQHQPASRDNTARPAALSSSNDDFLRQYASTLRFSLGRPRSITIAPDGGVLFLRSGPRSFVQDLHEFNPATGVERVLLTADQILAGQEEALTPEERARRERLRLATRGISGYQLSQDGATLLVPLSGRLFLIDRKTARSHEVKSSAGSPLDPRLSPDALHLACVRDSEVYVTTIASGEERKVTSGAGGTITNGLPEFVAQEEMGRFEGFWWSPDSRTIAFQQTDTAGMEVFHIADPMHPEREPHAWPYPRPGKNNASVKLGLVSIQGGEPTWVRWDREKYPYLATVKWPNNAPLTMLVQNRTQTEQLLLAVDPATGATTELLRETDAAWLNLEQSVPLWMDDGQSFVWLTERTGDWTLERRARAGKLIESIATKGFTVEAVLGSNGRDTVFTTAIPHLPNGGRDPKQVQVVRLTWAAGQAQATPLTLEPGQHSGTFHKKAEVWAHSYLLTDGTTAVRVERTPLPTVQASTPPVLGALSSQAEEPPFMPRPEFTTVTNHQLHAAVIRPRNFDRRKKYPVINYVYGGPHTNVVNANPRSYLLHQWLADHGFIVVAIDARGTPRRGRTWERVIKNNVIDIPLADHAAAIQALAAKYPEMDATRVGVTGWSFGGYFSAIAAMRRPDLFKAAVAGAPVCDWLDYDTHYTERYMGLPQENPAGYAASNVLTYCKDLSVPLLIIHGTADDNVYFMHSLKMSEALFRANRKHEFLPLTGFTHMVPDPEITVSLQTRIAAFMREHLGEPR